jgi:sugar phosphate isomerase/epimerase
LTWTAPAGRILPDSVPEFSPKLGICTSIVNAAAVKSAGGDYVEESVQGFLLPDKPDSEFREKAKSAEGPPLPVLACNNFLPASLKSVGPDARPDEIVAYAESAFRRAGEIGVTTVVFGSSGSRSIPGGFDRAEARRQFVGLLRRLGPIAAAHGVVVAIEPLNRDECNFINTVAEGAAIVREAGHPNIRLLADIYHMLRENEGPEALVAAGPLLRHVHLAEKDRRTPPGVAGDDFRPYLQALRRAGYAGAISIECRWEDLAAQLPAALKALREQLARLDGAFPRKSGSSLDLGKGRKEGLFSQLRVSLSRQRWVLPRRSPWWRGDRQGAESAKRPSEAWRSDSKPGFWEISKENTSLPIFRRIAASSAQPRFCRVAPKSPLPAAGGPGS